MGIPWDEFNKGISGDFGLASGFSGTDFFKKMANAGQVRGDTGDERSIIPPSGGMSEVEIKRKLLQEEERKREEERYNKLIQALIGMEEEEEGNLMRILRGNSIGEL